MKRILSILVFLMSVSLVNAAEQDSLFTVAQQHYIQRNYEKAFHIYDGLIREGYTSPNLYYNFANACLQTDRPARAIAYYEKALKSRPDDTEIQNNLVYSRKQLGVTDIQEISFWSKMDEKYLYIINIVLVWIVLLLIAYILLLVRPAHRKKLYYGLLLIGICTVYISIQSALVYQYKHLKTFAIAQEEMVMHKDPAKFSTEVYDIFAGQKVEILQSKNGWSEVITERNKQGWVQSDGLVQL